MCVEDIACNISVVFLRHSVYMHTDTAICFIVFCPVLPSFLWPAHTNWGYGTPAHTPKSGEVPHRINDENVNNNRWHLQHIISNNRHKVTSLNNKAMVWHDQHQTKLADDGLLHSPGDDLVTWLKDAAIKTLTAKTFTTTVLHHSVHGSAELLKGDEPCQWKTPIFTPSQIENPWTDRHQIWQGWLRRGLHTTC